MIKNVNIDKHKMGILYFMCNCCKCAFFIKKLYLGLLF